MDEKPDRPKLLRWIPKDIHDGIMKDLEELRIQHPSYRDDQLLVHLLAKDRTHGATFIAGLPVEKI